MQYIKVTIKPLGKDLVLADFKFGPERRDFKSLIDYSFCHSQVSTAITYRWKIT